MNNFFLNGYEILRNLFLVNKDFYAFLLNGTKKTAEKLIAALKDKIAEISVNNEQKWQEVSTNSSTEIEAIEALLTLGYKDLQARTAVSKVISQNNKLEVAQIVKEALKYL